MTLNRILKIEVNKEYTGLRYTYDGAFSPRVKGQDKRKRSKQTRAKRKRIDRKEISGFIV